jgi:hypothetical protein
VGTSRGRRTVGARGFAGTSGNVCPSRLTSKRPADDRLTPTGCRHLRRWGLGASSGPSGPCCRPRNRGRLLFYRRPSLPGGPATRPQVSPGPGSGGEGQALRAVAACAGRASFREPFDSVVKRRPMASCRCQVGNQVLPVRSLPRRSLQHRQDACTRATRERVPGALAPLRTRGWGGPRNRCPGCGCFFGESKGILGLLGSGDSGLRHPLHLCRADNTRGLAGALHIGDGTASVRAAVAVGPPP